MGSYILHVRHCAAHSEYTTGIQPLSMVQPLQRYTCTLLAGETMLYAFVLMSSSLKAYKGAQLLGSASGNNSLVYETLPELDKLLEQTDFVDGDQVVFPDEIYRLLSESKIPNLQHILHDSIPGVLEPESIVKISHHFESPGMEVELKRARFQILANLAKKRIAQQSQH